MLNKKVKLDENMLFKLFLIFALLSTITYLVINLCENSKLNDSIVHEWKQQQHIEEFKRKVQRAKYEVNCRGIFEMNTLEITRAKNVLSKIKTYKNTTTKVKLLPNKNFIFDKSECSLFKSIRGYETKFTHKSSEDEFEQAFPLAFSVLVYNNVEQLERLLRIIYRPQNIYCIHVDLKSSPTVKKAIESIAACFENVFIATQLEFVVYASFNRLKADLNCMSDLLNLDHLVHNHTNLIGKRSVNWKYMLNMASSEFPLRTNYELTRILDMYNGSNEIEIIKKISSDRVKISWEFKNNSEVPYKTNRTKSNPPHRYKIVKGYAFGAFSKDFLLYALNDRKAQDLLAWANDTWSPDEW